MAPLPGPVREIGVARNEAEVVAAVAKYLGSILPSEFAAIPGECRIFNVSTPQEVVEAAVTLTSCEPRIGHDEQGSDLLRSMVRVFRAASHRISRMHNPLNTMD
jgi:hypothetical protein